MRSSANVDRGRARVKIVHRIKRGKVIGSPKGGENGAVAGAGEDSWRRGGNTRSGETLQGVTSDEASLPR